jgi:phosphoribosylanthranilate isomerase
VHVDVKVCGITRPEDATRAVAAGAAYLGIVLASSPRRVQMDQARRIVEAAGAVPVLGVFGGQQLTSILHTVAELGLRGVQLQASHPRDFARRIKDTGLLVWRSVRVITEDALGWVGPTREAASAVLIDIGTLGISGPEGVSLPLYLAREARAQLPGHQMVLAGGLTPTTVAEAVALVHPDIVDVSAGVESSPGVKDPELLVAFMEAAVGEHSSP